VGVEDGEFIGCGFCIERSLWYSLVHINYLWLKR